MSSSFKRLKTNSKRGNLTMSKGYVIHYYSIGQRIILIVTGILFLILGLVSLLLAFSMMGPGETPSFLIGTGVIMFAIGLKPLFMQEKKYDRLFRNFS